MGEKARKKDRNKETEVYFLMIREKVREKVRNKGKDVYFFNERQIERKI